ncbi:MAG: tetraacyldisaccharide 4'-kinase [Legionellaceae bacterium]|nr:tetraacyldisaccharide 4'-kinase [Legionellaceae bacterium]
MWLLYPFSVLYGTVVCIRRWCLKRYCQVQFNVPVVVVGNLTVGGVGKTPLVVALAHHFTAKGLRVGIVSRGYGAKRKQFPYEVKPTDEVRLVGDEPLLLAQKTKRPVVIAPKRVEAVHYLLKNHAIDVVISDDGLQHYQMGRALEIVVIDGARRFGNGFYLPAGPLRESPKRLEHADFVVVNGGGKAGAYRMDLVPGEIYPSPLPTHVTVAAIAGIGHPTRFFDTLKGLGIAHKPYCFPDHHSFVPDDLKVPEDVVVMTEKDAVKCRLFSDKPMYVLPVQAQITDDFWGKLDAHECFQR